MSDREWKFVQYDAALNSIDDPKSTIEVASSLVDALQQKGFCVLDAKAMVDSLAEGGNLLKDADHEVRQLEEAGCFERPPVQIVRGLLGEDGSLSICEVDNGVGDDDEGGSGQDDSSLKKLNQILNAVMGILQPVTETQLALSFGGRTAPFLHVAGDASEEEDDAPALTEAEADKWLSVFVNQRLMLLLFLGPGKGHLELHPFRHEDSPLYVASTEAGTVVVLRSDTITQRYYSYERSVVLTSWLAQTTLDEERADPGADEAFLPPAARELMGWISDRMKVLKEKEVMTSEGATYGTDLSREWQSAMNHTYYKGVQCAVRGMACRFPGTWDAYSTWCGLNYGADMASEVPMLRWKHEDFYDSQPESWKYYKIYTKHGVFIEGADLFDPKPFGLAVYEAKGMDPCQRHILETSYECLFDAGFAKKSLMRSLVGVYIGAATTEFAFAENCNEGVGTSCSGAITSNRVSFCLGMQGPSFTADLGGAAALGALCSAVNSIRFQTDRYKANHTALSGAVNLLLAPNFYVLGCAAGFLSAEGRSQSFDVTAAGYVRGEGVGGLVINPFAELVDGVPVRDGSRPFHGNISSISVNHCGQTASLTAPSGPQETHLVCEAVRQASLSPLDVDFVECWGEAGILSDACAVKAVTKALREDDTSTVLGMSSAQSSLGFMHESTGMAQLFKVIFGSKLNTQAPGIHLAELNPHIDAWEGEPLNFQTESVHFKHVSAFSSVSSKNSSGVMGHAILWGEVDYQRCLPRRRLKRDAIAFWPAGGGELPEGAEPRRGYSIVGSWAGSEWTEVEPMKAEGDGVYGYTLTLGVNRFERFQIWLDGDDQRVLHPGMADAPKNVPALGPHSMDDSEGFTWLVDGREQFATAVVPILTDADRGEEEEASSQLQSTQDPYSLGGLPGDQYRVRLHVAGKWRTVDWKQVSRAPAMELGKALPDDGRYYVSCSWNAWSFTAMDRGESVPGTYHAEVRVAGYGGEFQIIRNRDWQQVFFPSAADKNAVDGPGTNDTDASWPLHGRPGEVFRIEFRRSWEAGAESRAISWRRIEQ